LIIANICNAKDSKCKKILTMKNSSLHLVEGVTDRTNRSREDVDRNALSPRERAVMLLAVRGLANKEIARELKVTEGTVKIHLHRIYQKLGIKSRFSLAALSRKPSSAVLQGEDRRYLPKERKRKTPTF
jgi:DNA-binding NarL/FixJ family response regulator